jgi:uncharacterized protein
MPFFALEYTTVDRFTERRAPFRADHLALVRASHERGELPMAGALGDPPDGALLIFQSDTADAAETFARTDPYVQNGLVTSWRVRPWHVVVTPGS